MAKNGVSYLLYIIFLNKGEALHIIISFLGLFYSVLGFKAETMMQNIAMLPPSMRETLMWFKDTGVSLTVLTFIWFLLVIGYSLYFGFLKEYRKFRKKRCSKAPPDKEMLGKIARISPNQTDVKLKFEVVSVAINRSENKIENVLYSKHINRFLRDHGHSIRIKRDKKRPKDIRKKIISNECSMTFLYWKYFQSYANCQDFYNQSKLCLSSDILTNERIVSCHKGSYYDTYLTNIISIHKLRSNENHEDIVADGTLLFPFLSGSQEAIKNISDSLLNNEIGVSTIGLTKDNYLLLWKQNSRAQSSVNLLVPTGSGSCDWSNWRWSRSSNRNLAFVITKAMNKELWEESCSNASLSEKITTFIKQYSNVGETKVVGYFRWLSKGGKSEFVGITKLAKNRDEYTAEKKEVYDEGGQFWCRSFTDFKSVINDVLLNSSNISIPLYINLLCLQHCITESDASVMLEKFLYPKGPLPRT